MKQTCHGMTNVVFLLALLATSFAAQQRRTLRSGQSAQDGSADSSPTTRPNSAVTVDVKLQASAHSSKLRERSQYFAICVSAKDQHDDIAEWLQYHEQIGTGTVCIYDDSSSSLMLGRLKSHIESGLVDYHFIGQSQHSSIPRPQLWVYDQCIDRYRSKHSFIAFIDVDEFLFLRDPNISSMPQLLKEFEGYGGLAVNWVQFGSSGHVHRPHGGTLASYWKCIPKHHPENLHVKSIVNTKYVERATGDPHHFTYLDGKQAVSEKFVPVNGARSDSNEISRIALYHYVTKSRDQYVHKIGRGSAMKNFKTIDFFDAVEKEATSNCTDAMLWGTSSEDQP